MNNECIEALETIENAVAKSTSHFHDLRKRCDDIFEQRVQHFAGENGVNLQRAHALAASDDIAKRAYALSVELADKHSNAIKAAGGIAAYVE